MDECKEIHGIVYIEDDILGRIEMDGVIEGIVHADGVISGIVNYRQCTDYETYDGDYIVTPKVYSQMLDTDNKLMADDVTVLAVPYYETTNPSGTTVYIAGEL